MQGLWVAGLMVVGAGCSGGGYEETLVDTTGIRIQRSCSETDCDYTFLDDPGCGGGTPGLLGGRFITVCSSTNDAIFMENCRAVACTNDKTCDIFGTPFKCRDAVCTASAATGESESIRQALGDILRSVDKRFEQKLTLAKKAGILGPEADAKILGSVLGGVAHTLAVRARSGASEASLRALARGAVSLLF